MRPQTSCLSSHALSAAGRRARVAQGFRGRDAAALAHKGRRDADARAPLRGREDPPPVPEPPQLDVRLRRQPQNRFGVPSCACQCKILSSRGTCYMCHAQGELRSTVLPSSPIRAAARLMYLPPLGKASALSRFCSKYKCRQWELSLICLLCAEMGAFGGMPAYKAALQHAQQQDEEEERGGFIPASYGHASNNHRQAALLSLHFCSLAVLGFLHSLQTSAMAWRNHAANPQCLLQSNVQQFQPIRL